MYQLLGITPRVPGSTLRNPMWNYVRDRMGQNLAVLQDYYNNHDQRIDSSHLLLKVINFFSAGNYTDLSAFYQMVSIDALRIAHSLQMTSSLSFGKTFPGVFFGPGIQEIIIATDTPFNYRHGYANWRNLRPIKVVSHPFSDLTCPIPIGRNYTKIRDTAVIEVNIPMLMIQYKAFRDYERVISEPGSERTAANFLGMYALPGMIYSYADHAVFNRLYNLIEGRENVPVTFSHPMSLVRVDTHINQLQIEIARVISERKYLVAEMLSTIQLIDLPSANELAILPETVGNRQTDWAKFTARIKFIELIVEIAKRVGGKQNRSDIQKIAREIRYARISGLLTNSMPRDLAEQISGRYNRVADMIERNDL